MDNVELTIVENGREAIECLEAANYDLVLMDINMPIMTGAEAIVQIRKSETRYTNIPIVVLTANVLAEHSSKYLEIGATEYIAKPLDVDKLIARIEEYRADLTSKQAA